MCRRFFVTKHCQRNARRPFEVLYKLLEFVKFFELILQDRQLLVIQLVAFWNGWVMMYYESIMLETGVYLTSLVSDLI